MYNRFRQHAVTGWRQQLENDVRIKSAKVRLQEWARENQEERSGGALQRTA